MALLFLLLLLVLLVVLISLLPVYIVVLYGCSFLCVVFNSDKDFLSM